jgi:hypothetical protein
MLAGAGRGSQCGTVLEVFVLDFSKESSKGSQNGSVGSKPNDSDTRDMNQRVS